MARKLAFRLATNRLELTLTNRGVAIRDRKSAKWFIGAISKKKEKSINDFRKVLRKFGERIWRERERERETVKSKKREDVVHKQFSGRKNNRQNRSLDDVKKRFYNHNLQSQFSVKNVSHTKKWGPQIVRPNFFFENSKTLGKIVCCVLKNVQNY